MSTSHVIFHIDGKGSAPGKVGCARCHSQFKVTDPATKHWLKCPCRELGSARDRPIPIPYEEIHLGNRVTHHSHKLFKLKGLIYCNVCGCRSVTKLLGLGSPCAPPDTYGKGVLKAIRLGRLPHGLEKWPSDD